MVLLHHKWKLNRPPLDVPFEVNWDSPQAQGLVAWWPALQERGPLVLLDPVRGNNGVFGGGATWGVIGERGAALKFSGNTGVGTDMVMLPQATSVRGLSQVSVSLWYYPTQNPPSTNPYMYYESTANPGSTRLFIVHAINSTTIGAAARDTDAGDVFYFTVANVLTSNVWHHIVLTYNADSDLFALYRNGVLIGSDTAAKGAFTSGAPVDGPVIGAYKYAGNTGNQRSVFGYISDVRLYNCALNAAVVWQMYDPATRWELYRPLRRWWPGFVAGGVPMALFGQPKEAI